MLVVLTVGTMGYPPVLVYVFVILYGDLTHAPGQ